jgi:hypothetical protein
LRSHLTHESIISSRQQQERRAAWKASAPTILNFKSDQSRRHMATAAGAPSEQEGARGTLAGTDLSSRGWRLAQADSNGAELANSASSTNRFMDRKKLLTASLRESRLPLIAGASAQDDEDAGRRLVRAFWL